MKEKIIELLKSVNRVGMDKLIEYLEKDTDFFSAPASTQYHSNNIGGLAKHSLNVYNLLQEKIERHYKNGEISDQSVKICSLLHDVCKINFYKEGFKWAKDAENKWIKEKTWVVEDSFPVGHGEKSVFILQRFIELTDEEVAAIRFHMGMTETGTHFPPLSFMYRTSMDKYPLVSILHTADIEATFILEKQLSTP